MSAETGSLRKLGNDWLKTVSMMVKTYSGIDEPTKKLITKTIAAFFKAARHNIPAFMPVSRGGPKIPGP
jgi:hypothetical protein